MSATIEETSGPERNAAAAPQTGPESATAPATRHFDQVFRSISDVQGWMTRDQACRLWDRAADLCEGDRIVEIGSFHGRSAIVLASAAPEGVEIITIDPHGGNDRGPHEFEGYEDEAEQDHQIFLANLRRAGVHERIRHLRLYSHDALGEVPGEIDLLYIDGAHRYAPALDDIKQWAPKVSLGGTMLIHDSFAAWGLTLAIMRELFWSGKFRYLGRSQTMAEYQRADLTPADRVTNLIRQLLELPYFARNLAIKVLIKAKLAPLTKLLGGNGEWPY
jgi:hypothetical protein